MRAAEEAFVADPVVVPHPSGTSATLRVSTDLDMACAVVSGRDGSLGDGIATDMGGGAHRDHEAVMRGLQPGTEYLYRVQGSGADGALHRSEPRTFRTPDAVPVAVPGDEVTGARVVAVSSQFSGPSAGPLAVDGDLAAEWSSAGDGDDASITLDLGRPVEVAGLTVRSRATSDGTSVIETSTVTVDGDRTYGPFEAGTAVVVTEVDLTGQVLRIDAEQTTGGNTGAAEIQVYEAR
ncbi:fibronectin type III domain-containing protein [Geodermatophilus sp. DSM 44513]|uniref:fibronectin type III domain-containing protein n=1 Tax=Geodermatophilus sp. DSM 44513 TaxID=1528104 RepID=UPI00126F826E|nr:fibronectin type III domain-containing protein [Geodermatophilus sp. DSM 44513]WNV75380.1 hypothetical protein RTG05_20765 [Geodermatophilus sp. DSM 44513]